MAGSRRWALPARREGGHKPLRDARRTEGGEGAGAEKGNDKRTEHRRRAREGGCGVGRGGLWRRGRLLRAEMDRGWVRCQD